MIPTSHLSAFMLSGFGQSFLLQCSSALEFKYGAPSNCRLFRLATAYQTFDTHTFRSASVYCTTEKAGGLAIESLQNRTKIALV